MSKAQRRRLACLRRRTTWADDLSLGRVFARLRRRALWPGDAEAARADRREGHDKFSRRRPSGGARRAQADS